MMNSQRCYKNFDKLKFKADLVKVNWDGYCLTSNPNDALAHFLKIILLDEHAPYKTIKYSKTCYETKPWITPCLANSIRNKHKLYKSFCKEKDPKSKEYYENHIVIIYLNCSERQKINLTISTILKATKKILG